MYAFHLIYAVLTKINIPRHHQQATHNTQFCNNQICEFDTLWLYFHSQLTYIKDCL